MIRRLRMLKAGGCVVDASVLMPRRPRGQKIRLPIWMYLIEAADGLFLVDTGMPRSCVANPDYFKGTEDEGLILPEMTADDHVTAVLGRLGLRPQDVDAVVATHLHFDHGGGLAAFADVPVLLQEEEHALARRGEVWPECFPEGPVYRPYAGDRELAPGLRLLHTPGHTPGHTSVLVEPAGEAPILLTIDAVYTRENWEGEPGAFSEPERAERSVARLRELAQSAGARVFFGHDTEQAALPEWRRYQA
ncbi:MAG: N-acyl homoserine lactonase family protein [Firmicutes bacterium]|nr:N-acyl homoserine lactonase family protein [Bacillota bacterium]